MQFKEEGETLRKMFCSSVEVLSLKSVLTHIAMPMLTCVEGVRRMEANDSM